MKPLFTILALWFYVGALVWNPRATLILTGLGLATAGILYHKKLKPYVAALLRSYQP